VYKQRILELKATNVGLGYKKIAKLVGCSQSLVRHYLNDVYRGKAAHRQCRNRKSNADALKVLFGGKCVRCGYDRCLGALHFHHVNADKTCGINTAFRYFGKAIAVKEAQKCELICANCHAEEHAKTLPVGRLVTVVLS
jgi:5-methylcytosine-specific restriction endonuclease McrA